MAFNDLRRHRHGTQIHRVSMHLGARDPVMRSLRALPVLPLRLPAVVPMLARLRRRALHQMYDFSIDI